MQQTIVEVFKEDYEEEDESQLEEEKMIMEDLDLLDMQEEQQAKKSHDMMGGSSGGGVNDQDQIVIESYPKDQNQVSREDKKKPKFLSNVVSYEEQNR